MRKLLVFLLISLVTTMAWGEKVVTFLPEEFGEIPRPNPGEQICVTNDCVTMCCTDGYFNQVQFRLYKLSEITFTSTCGPITRIEFICTAEGENLYGPGALTVTQGSYSYEDNIGLWQGAADQVAFTAATNQVRATRIDVYVDDGELQAPKIEPASGTYYEPIEVKISCLSSDASIYYTLDGSDPTTASTLYTMPFSLSNDATVKAVAEREGELSEVVSAAFQFGTAQQIRCFEDLADISDQTTVRFCAPLYALAQSGQYLYVKDECGGYGLIYGNTKQSYKNGDVIPEGAVLNKTTFDGEPEYQVIGGFLPATSNIPIEPEVINPAQVGLGTALHYVRINHVTISQGESINSYILTDEDGNSCVAYFARMGTPVPDLSLIYDVIGIVGSYSNGGEKIYQLLVTEVICVNPPTMGFGMLEDVDDDTEVTMTYNATVIYQFAGYLYAKDETGYGLVYGNVGQTYNMGDVIPAGFGGLKVTFSCEPELKNPGGFQPPVGHVELVPEEITLQQVNHSMWGHYVVIRDVKIDPENKLFVDEAGNECSFYNRFSVVIPENSEGLCDVYGVIGSYKHGSDCIYQILPISIVGRFEPYKVCCIEDVLALPEGVPVQFECPLIVVYQSGNHLYVKDTCGEYTLMYGNMNGTFENGDSIIGAVTWTTYMEKPQLKPYGDWSLVAHGPQVPPIGPMMIEEISQDMVHSYVYFEDVTVTQDEERDRYYTMIDKDGSEMLMYNQFNIEIPTADAHPVIIIPNDVNGDGSVNVSDLNEIINYILTGKSSDSGSGSTGENSWDNCRVEGLVAMYKETLELFPTRVTVNSSGDLEPWRRYDINHDGSVNISDVNDLIGFILKN